MYTDKAMEPLVPKIKNESDVHQGTGSETKPEKVLLVRPIRTMKSDMEEAIKRQNETSVSIAIAEEKKKARARAEALAAKQAQAEDNSLAPKRVGRLVIVLVFMLLLSLSALTYLFILPKLGAIQIPTISLPIFEKAAEIVTPPVIQIAEPLAPSIISAQFEKRFNLSKETREQVIARIAAEKGKGSPSGTIKNLYFIDGDTATSTETSADKLLVFLNAQTPAMLARSLEKQFMLGFFGEANGGAAPFLLLKVSDHNTGLAGMLEWENSLSAFFNTLFNISVSGVKSTAQKFSNIVVLGKDARVQELAPGVKVIYLFANQNSIIITESLSATEGLLTLVGSK